MTKDEGLDIDLLMKLAKGAAAKVTSHSRHMREEVEAELLAWAWRKRDNLRNYLTPTEDNRRERENKLFVSLVRQGYKVISAEIRRENTEASVDPELLSILLESNESEGIENVDDGANSYIKMLYRSMTEGEVKRLLPLISESDESLQQGDRELASLLRDSIHLITPEQRAVYELIAQGLSVAEVAERLAISELAVTKRMERAQLASRSRVPLWHNSARSIGPL